MNDRDRDKADNWMREHMPSEEATNRFSPIFPSSSLMRINPPGAMVNSIPAGRKPAKSPGISRVVDDLLVFSTASPTR